MTQDDRVLDGPLAPRPAPELPRPFPVTRIGAGASFVVEARPEECRALARRMGIDAIHSLVCRFELRRQESDKIEAAGHLTAKVRQACVVSLEPFDADIAENFSIRFVPDGKESEDLDLESDDEVTYEGGILELGEAAAEQLALTLDPFPRKPGAELPREVALPEGGAFAGLSKLLPPH